MRSWSDARLVAACLASNSDAWSVLLDRYSSLIYSILVRQGLTSADAEDLFQEVWVLVLDHLKDLRDADHLASWLSITTKRVIWRWRRKRGAKLFSDMADREWELERAPAAGAPAPDSVEDTILALVDQQLVRQAMSQLPERCSQLLSTLYCRTPPSSYLEAAAELDMPVGSIGPSRIRCLQQLKEILDKIGF